MLFTPEHIPNQSSLDVVAPATPDAIDGDINSKKRVAVREKIKVIESFLGDALSKGDLKGADYSYNHYFTSKHEDFGAHLYGRELSLSAGSVAVGKIHKHPAINILLKGKLYIVSENGKKLITAPCIYASEPGVKRVAYAIEDCVWANVIMTKHDSEEKLDLIEQDHIAQSYEDLGMIDSLEKLEKLLEKS